MRVLPPLMRVAMLLHTFNHFLQTEILVITVRSCWAMSSQFIYTCFPLSTYWFLEFQSTWDLNLILLLIIGLYILLRVYRLNIGITSVRNIVFFSARFYCAPPTLHVSAPFDCHLQVVRKHK
jgi:hypothetical protein